MGLVIHFQDTLSQAVNKLRKVSLTGRRFRICAVAQTDLSVGCNVAHGPQHSGNNLYHTRSPTIAKCNHVKSLGTQLLPNVTMLKV